MEMTKSRAIKILNIMTTTIQKMRSITRENGIDDDLAEMVTPWIFGPKCPLLALITIVNKARATGELAPGDFFNMMAIAYRLQPEIAVFASLFVTQDTEPFPAEEPDYTQYLRGWAEETNE